jgi:hypothetical protein
MLVSTLRLHDGTQFLNTDLRENLKALLSCVLVGHRGLVYYLSLLVIRFLVYFSLLVLHWLKCYEIDERSELLHCARA